MKIKRNISLKNKNWFRTGGKAKYYCEPKTNQDFIGALEFSKDKNVEVFVLGEGANVLISDNGFDGLIIKPMLKNIKILNKELIGKRPRTKDTPKSNKIKSINPIVKQGDFFILNKDRNGGFEEDQRGGGNSPAGNGFFLRETRISKRICCYAECFRSCGCSRP